MELIRFFYIFIHKNILSFLNGINKKEHEFKEKSTISDGKIKKEFNQRRNQLKDNLKVYWKF